MTNREEQKTFKKFVSETLGFRELEKAYGEEMKRPLTRKWWVLEDASQTRSQSLTSSPKKRMQSIRKVRSIEVLTNDGCS